jgi:hypothetical protein
MRARPLAADFDWERLLHQVLCPPHDGGARYPRYDRTDGRLAD